MEMGLCPGLKVERGHEHRTVLVPEQGLFLNPAQGMKWVGFLVQRRGFVVPNPVQGTK